MMPSDLNSLEYTFFMCAVGGTLFFALRVMMSIVGGFGDHDVGGGDHDLSHMDTGGADMDASGADTAHGAHDSDVAFKLLSLNSISAFIMMFGWAGLAASRQHQLSSFLSFAVAFSVGFLMMVITSSLFVLAHKFTTEGAEFKVDDVVGKNAKVYMRIPKGGRGRVHLSIDGILRELDAEADSSNDIESFASVTIIEALGPSLVKVKPTDS